MLQTVTAVRYLTPLREGGSLPALVEADDLGTYVVKFRGAGQGLKALIAEIIAGELARRLGILVPDLVVVELDPAVARCEPDPEVQDLLAASGGSNLGVDFLPGALGYDGVSWQPDPDLAARILWFDGLVVNVDRSWRNPNLLVWHGRLWCIDHGATLIFHHAWPKADAFAQRPYDVSDHALAPLAGSLAEADAMLAPLVDRDLLTEVVTLVPDDWLRPQPGLPTPDAVRRAYVSVLLDRLAARASWLGAMAA